MTFKAQTNDCTEKSPNTTNTKWTEQYKYTQNEVTFRWTPVAGVQVDLHVYEREEDTRRVLVQKK